PGEAIEGDGWIAASPSPPRNDGLLNAGELIRRADQAVEDTGLAEQVAAIRYEVELDLGPCLLQLPRGDRRGAAVVTPLDDYARDPAQLLRAAQQLAFLEPALSRHIMVLDPRDGDRHL